ncbi:MAG: ABC transporter ATP-binding protein [Alphaproteobacteria bacterium]|nr:MAG: ABC transporter ATP-binding protein [Alphaproteobacteria bacterium]
MADVQLKATQIRKQFGSFVALDGIDVGIERGELLTLLGPSGSGKTTFLMILAGFFEPTSGRLEEGGVDITRRPAELRRYGMVFQGYALFPHMTVEENVGFPLRIQKVAPAERKRRVDAMLATVGLEAHRDKRPSQLSGGQQQRVALARALVFEPKVLLLDEPLSALDKNLREQMRNEIKQLHQKTGATFVFVTHDQTEALALSSRLAIFDRGRLQQIGRPEEVYERPTNRFVAEFLGRINLLPLSDPRHDGPLLHGRFEDRPLAAVANGTAATEGAMLAVRPEYMALSPGARTEGGWNAVQATVAGRIYVGATSLIQLRTRSGIELSLEMHSADPHARAAPGSEIWVSWPVERSFALSARGSH